MSGHSKWSKVKHQKAATDALKSSAFTRVSRAITVAVREGGGITDPAGNFRLRLAIDSARAVNMPKETIVRAIERAKTSNENLEPFLYEGYDQGGVAFLVSAVSDNKQRTASIIKHIFERAGGSLTGSGSVIYQFQRIVDASNVVYRPISPLVVSSEIVQVATHLKDELEKLDDVTAVFTNL